MFHNRLISNLLHINNLRKFLGNVSFSLAVKSKFKLEILENPPSGKVLVLAPHPDDDVFGCGGALALHQKNSDQIKIIYLTSTPQRIKEAEASAKLLKISDIEFWGFKEGKFSATKKSYHGLIKVIDTYKPDIIYCPSFTDSHPDHFETAKILYSALCHPERSRSVGRDEGSTGLTSILLYEIWTPIYANRLIKIDSVINTKKAAISCHQSQMKERRYSEAILGLNAYRAGMFSAGNFAEAFTALTPELHIKLFEIYSLK